MVSSPFLLFPFFYNSPFPQPCERLDFLYILAKMVNIEAQHENQKGLPLFFKFLFFIGAFLNTITWLFGSIWSLIVVVLRCVLSCSRSLGSRLYRLAKALLKKAKKAWRDRPPREVLGLRCVCLGGIVSPPIVSLIIMERAREHKLELPDYLWSALPSLVVASVGELIPFFIAKAISA